jgi:hypothetical protein
MTATVANLQTCAGVRDLALRVWQIAHSCSDAKAAEELAQLSFELMDRAADLEELRTAPAALEKIL